MKSIKINRLISSLAAVLLIFGAFFIVKAMEDKSENQFESFEMLDWEFTQNVSSDPLNPENYTEGTTSHCDGSEQLCGIRAPDNGSGDPHISPALAQRIQSNDLTNQDVFLKDN